jgi:hypothetical protein
MLNGSTKPSESYPLAGARFVRANIVHAAAAASTGDFHARVSAPAGGRYVAYNALTERRDVD